MTLAGIVFFTPQSPTEAIGARYELEQPFLRDQNNELCLLPTIRTLQLNNLNGKRSKTSQS